MKKLQHFEIRGRIFDYLSYLTDREQDVAVYGTFSTTGTIDSDIPQVLNLGLLLFLLHLNNLSRSLETSNFIHFYDDTTVFLSHPNSDALNVSFNEELCEVSEWLRVNRLFINVEKNMPYDNKQ